MSSELTTITNEDSKPKAKKKLVLKCCHAKLWKGEKCKCTIITTSSSNKMSSQSQKHGFTIENDIKEKVFDLPPETNNTDKHDIPKEKNKYDINENISIKTTGSKTICCGDILSFYNYNFNEKNTIIVTLYDQTNTHKIIKNIYEIDYNADCHKLLFRNLPKEIIEEYVKNVKSIPKKTKGKDAKKIFNYIDEKKNIKKKYNHNIQINPKVDSSQSRVQCSITNFEETLKDFIKYKSPCHTPNLIRGKEICASIESSRRIRNKK